MTRADARELAVHLIYGREFTGEEPEQIISTRLKKDYYKLLSEENQIYTEIPSGKQVAYLDTVVSGVANRVNELNAYIQKYSIGWDISRISKLYDGDDTGAFVNGILGAFARSLSTEVSL